ncbi:CotH kinase family protein [Paenibacillus nasutitermitis]|uniref:Spore coat protein CotH n=1 Tax=Paenibacillus nasutitermitis TaxID=1652958 RepID=A0A916Z5M1_9BACL|nr:CotH kinase family protein [Paenibacillus nasutitermitis]GGD77210.1 hypothetical protein GCM10010911_39050 [Paenibacillus nasutitermitis]
MKAKAASILICLCCLLLIAGLAGCSSPVTSGVSTDSSTGENTGNTEKNQGTAESAFPKDKVVDVKITVDKDDFQDMMDNASAEEYKTASIDYNGEHFDNVAIRAKGNLSLRSVVNMPDSERYSLKISFDEYLNQTLSGISKINLNNNYSDPSYMREFLTYELAESMGLPTPYYSFVNVYVNGELWGFYLAVEQIGDAYLKRNFDNSYGALYKGVMTGAGSDLTWLGDDPDSYTGLVLKSDKSDDDILIDMLNELNNGTDYEKYLDVEESLKYIALNIATANMDSYLGFNKQNYYLYDDDGVFSILPWDYNMAFGGFGSSSVMIDEPTQGALAERPLAAKLLAVDEYKAEYHDILQKMVDGYLADETFQARVKELTSLISPYVKADPSSFYTYEEYEAGVTALTAFNTKQVKSLAQQLDGTLPSAGDGSGSGMGSMGAMGGMGGGRGQGGPGGQNVAGAQDGQNAQGGQPAAGAQAGQDAQGGQPAAGAQAGQDAQGGQPAAGAQAGQNAQDGQPAAGAQAGQDAQGGQPADGAQGGPGGFGGQMGPPPGGFGGGGMGGPGDFGGPGGQGAQQTGSTSAAITTGVAVVILLLACLFVIFYKRKRL